MRNFVLFTNFIFLMCLLYTYSFLQVLIPHLLQRDPENMKLHYDQISKLNYATLAVMALTEIFIPRLRPLAAIYGIGYIYYQATLLFSGTAFTSDTVFVFFYVCTCFGIGTSFLYVKDYLRLTYQGFTKKELRSVEFETEKKVRCVDPVRGLSNLYAFYI